jgi:hypothetical protein
MMKKKHVARTGRTTRPQKVTVGEFERKISLKRCITDARNRL